MRQTVLPIMIHGKSRRRGAKAPRVALLRRDPDRPGAPGCVLAFPSPPNQVDRRVTRRRDTRSRSYAPAAVKSSKMPNKMLIDATHPEETRVVVVRGNRVEEFDFETAQRKQLRGNIYLAKVTRVEPSLQAAFIEYGGNRHGFLAFSEIHPDYYQIPVADRQALIEADERAHREAEEESENRSSRGRRPRHRNSRRRGNGERVQSEIVENASGEAPQAAEPAQPYEGQAEGQPYAENGHDGEHHGEAPHHADAGHHDQDHHEHAYDEHDHAHDEGTETHASETLAAVTLPDTAAVEAATAEAREEEEEEHAHHEHHDDEHHEAHAYENAAHAE